MDLNYSAEEASFRDEVRSWLGANLPPEPDLLARFQVSRTVLREVSKTLSAKGLGVSRASLVNTLIGVFSAWARLPTCMRARSMISKLD